IVPSSRRWQIVSRSGAAAPGTTPGMRSLPTAQRITSRPSRTSLSSATSILSSRRATASTRSTAPRGSSGPQARAPGRARGRAQRGAASRALLAADGIRPEPAARARVVRHRSPSAPCPQPTPSGGAEPSAGPGRAERDLGRPQALARDQPPLGLGAPRQRGQVDAGQPRIRAGDLLEGAPQRALALDAEGEHLELEHAAVRRVAGDPPVELRAAELLDRPAGPHLQRVAGDGEPRHDVDERRPVLGELAREALERRLERRAAVRAERAAGELDAAGRPGEVVVEVDRDEAAVHAGVPTRRAAGADTPGWSSRYAALSCGADTAAAAPSRPPESSTSKSASSPWAKPVSSWPRTSWTKTSTSSASSWAPETRRSSATAAAEETGSR